VTQGAAERPEEDTAATVSPIVTTSLLGAESAMAKPERKKKIK